MVEMQIDSLSFDPVKRTPIILLREYFGQGKTLTIPVGSMEGIALSLVLNNEALPRPLTHDLLLLCLKSMNCKMTHAEITSYQDGLFNAVIVLHSHQKGIRIQARPSDAITLAVRAGLSIYVNDQVFESLKAAQNNTSKDDIPITVTPDAATDMVRQISAQHLVEMMSASRHHATTPPKIDELCDSQLLELLRCLEPETRHKM